MEHRVIAVFATERCRSDKALPKKLGLYLYILVSSDAKNRYKKGLNDFILMEYSGVS